MNTTTPTTGPADHPGAPTGPTTGGGTPSVDLGHGVILERVEDHPFLPDMSWTEWFAEIGRGPHAVQLIDGGEPVARCVKRYEIACWLGWQDGARRPGNPPETNDWDEALAIARRFVAAQMITEP